MFKSVFKSRYSVVLYFCMVFIVISFLLRLGFVFWISNEFNWNIAEVLSTFGFGFLYDIAVVSCFAVPMTLYLALLPNKLVNTFLDKAVVYFLSSLFIIIFYFTFFAEITFWEEFKSRFNFIAVDYLIYTYEVINNIQESYPLEILISAILCLSLLTVYLGSRWKFYHYTFTSKASNKNRYCILLANVVLVFVLLYPLHNDTSSLSENRYNNEISKAGIFSFFSAFRNNHLLYKDHYKLMDHNKALALVKEQLTDSKTVFDQNHPNPLRRTILASNPGEPEKKPNVIFVLMESMSSSFLSETYNDKPLAGNLNELAKNGISFSNMFANGTRTVRGMEAVTLSIVPTPGHSIVKRVNNKNMYSISNVFQDKGYHNMFFYGGDGYFDNMNAFYGGNGFDIYDRGRGSVLSDKIPAKRYNISDDEVSFENAWGISDEDIYNKVVQVFDQKTKQDQPLFAFVMTTSNHRPYTYGPGKIDIPSGQGREGAVKYADYAIGEFIKTAKTKPWFDNTVFVFVADHCASSAGGSVIDVANYKIPAIIYNANWTPKINVEKQVAQIDIFPTLFSMLNWKYVSGFYGKDIFDPQYKSRSFVATYIQLGMKKDTAVVVLSDQRRIRQYRWDQNQLHARDLDSNFENEIISNYQSADYLYLNGLLNEK